MKLLFSIKEICIISIFAALTGILSQISIPIPFSPVPITLQVFAVCLSAVILGSRLAVFSQLVYILLGAIGLPVFANLSGGLQAILGPTGGFIISFPIMAFIIGKFIDNFSSTKKLFIGLFLGLFVCYFLGVIQLSFITKMGIQKAILLGAIPYIPLDIIKVILVAFIGLSIRKSLVKSKLLSY